MKRIMCVLIMIAMIAGACKKQEMPAVQPSDSTACLAVVQKYLRQHRYEAGYSRVDFERYRLSKQAARWYLRIALRNKLLSNDFVLLQTDSMGTVFEGRIIHIERTDTDTTIFNGSVTIGSLEGKTLVHSAITNGYIEAWHPTLFSLTTRSESHAVPFDELPEVIVTAYLPAASTAGISYGDFMLLQRLLEGGGSGAGGPDSENDAGGTGNGGGYAIYSPVGDGLHSNTNAPASPVDNDIRISIDDSAYRPAIDLEAWLKCFSDIPDAGADYSITLCADLPVDDDPSINVNYFTGATGHTFLQLRKTNGSQSVTQIIGFTAANALTALTNADGFVASKMVDNAGHKFDASLTMYVNSAGFTVVLDKMVSLSTMPYSIMRFDCLDYDLLVLNAIRPGSPLVLPTMYGSTDIFSQISTGQRMYRLLEQMKHQGSPDAANIFLGNGAGVLAGKSHGPCN